MRRRPKLARWIPLLTAVTVGACGGGETGQEPAPVITITGVQDGLVTVDPVTITIALDRGTYTATMNGATFVSGTTVSIPGSYALEVRARAGAATSDAHVDFEINLSGASMLIVRVLNLGANDAGGGGDAILLTDSSSAGLYHGLIDAGPAGNNASDPGFVARQLAALGVDSLSFVILSHAHGDHYGGMPAVLNAIPVGRFVYNGQVRTVAAYTNLITLAQSSAGLVIVPSTVTDVPLGPGGLTIISVLPPLTDSLNAPGAGGTGLNDGSLGVRVERGDFEMFFTGDGEVRATLRWRTTFADQTRSIDVLKVGHHGANNAIFDNGLTGTSSWLTHTTPAIAFVSANGTTHPRLNAVAALLARPGLRTFCTNVHGVLELRVNPDGAYRVDVERDGTSACVAGVNADTEAGEAGEAGNRLRN